MSLLFYSFIAFCPSCIFPHSHRRLIILISHSNFTFSDLYSSLAIPYLSDFFFSFLRFDYCASSFLQKNLLFLFSQTTSDYSSKTPRRCFPDIFFYSWFFLFFKYPKVFSVLRDLYYLSTRILKISYRYKRKKKFYLLSSLCFLYH